MKKKYNIFQTIEFFFVKYYTLRHSDYSMILQSAIIGVLTGLVVVLFHKIMQFADQFFNYLSVESIEYLKWYYLAIPLIPIIGGLMIGLLRKYFFHDIGMDSVHDFVKVLVYKNGKLDLRYSLKSMLLAAISIGSGGGAGREGPTIIVGGAFGSSIAQFLQLKNEKIKIFAGCGASAAISAIFNSPLGSIIFALEALMGDVGLKGFLPIVVSSILATATSKIILGDHTILVSPKDISVQYWDYLFLAIAGMLSGLVAIYYLKSYRKTAAFTHKYIDRFPEILRPAIGGLFLGILVLFLPTMLETVYNPVNYAIKWNAKGLVNASLLDYLRHKFGLHNIMILGLIVATLTVIFKPISNAVTLASGGAGGTFAPSIKVGAMFGFVFGYLLHLIYPGVTPGLYAVICAGSVLAGTYQMPMAAALILFEITGIPELLIPLLFSTVFSSFIVRKFKVKTFNPLQSDVVEDEDKLHPTLKNLNNENI